MNEVKTDCEKCKYAEITGKICWCKKKTGRTKLKDDCKYMIEKGDKE